MRGLWLLCVGAIGCGAPVEGPLSGVEERSERGYFRVTVLPPDGDFHRGVNAFALRAQTSEGGVMVGELSVRALMPSHAHVPTAATPRRDGAQWSVPDLELPMPGRWRIEATLQHDGLRDVFWHDVWVP